MAVIRRDWELAPMLEATEEGGQRVQQSPTPKYIPQLRISKHSPGYKELKVLLKTKKTEPRYLDNMIPTCSVQFIHSVPKYLGYGATDVDEDFLLIFSLEAHLHLFHSEIALMNKIPTSSTTTLTGWMRNIQINIPGTRFTLLIQGMEKYLSKIPKEEQKKMDDYVLAGGVIEDIGRINGYICRMEIKNVLIRLQLETKINYRFYETCQELAQLLNEYEIAVGENYFSKAEEYNEAFRVAVEKRDMAEKKYGAMLEECLPDKEGQVKRSRAIRRLVAFELTQAEGSSSKPSELEMCQKCMEGTRKEYEEINWFHQIEFAFEGRMNKLGDIAGTNIFNYLRMEAKRLSELESRLREKYKSGTEGESMDESEAGDESSSEDR